MGGAGGMHMTDSSTVEVAAGKTGSLTLTFPSAPGPYLYGCHVNGHYPAGIHGTITIS